MEFNHLEASPEYDAAREELRVAEIELMRHVHAVAEQRRKLPPGPTVDDYVFLEGPADLSDGDEPVHKVSLSELFTGPDRPLIVYHFMFGKKTEPCPMCTMWITGYNGVANYIDRGADFVIVAAADPSALRAYARERGWNNLRLLSAGDSTFQWDLGAEDEEGWQDSTMSVFRRDADGTIRHFYTAHPRMADDQMERGIDMLTPVWNLFDLTPSGRPDWYPTLADGVETSE